MTKPLRTFAGATGMVLAGALAACNIDTEPGVDAVIENTDITVLGAEATTVVQTDITITFRVGEHAQGERTFIPLRTELYAGDELAALINLDRSPEFDGTLAPGESETVTFHGETPEGAYPEARSLLCADGAEITVLLHWDDQTADEIGRTTSTSASVDCSPLL